MKNTTCSILFTAAAGLLIANCNKAGEQRGIRAIELITQAQFVAAANGQIYDRKDTVVLGYLDDIVILKEPYTDVKYNKNALHGNTLVASDDPKTIDAKERKYDYSIWKKDARQGIRYSDKVFPEIIDIDAVYRKKLFIDATFYNVAHDRLIETKIEGDNGSFLEKYACVSKPDASYCDTTWYRFSTTYADIPYSLSSIADSLKGSRLIEVRYVYNAIPRGISEKVDLPRREMSFKINKVVMPIDNYLKAILKRFETDSKKLIAQ